jgi:hypothetical protein
MRWPLLIPFAGSVSDADKQVMAAANNVIAVMRVNALDLIVRAAQLSRINRSILVFIIGVPFVKPNGKVVSTLAGKAGRFGLIQASRFRGKMSIQ